MTKVHKEIFLEELPRYRFGKGQPNGVIDWRNSKGYKVKGIYGELEFEVEILDYNTTTNKLSIKYKNEPIFKIHIGHFANCKLELLLMHDIYELQYDESNPRRVDLRKLPLTSCGINWNKIIKNKIKIPFVHDDIKGFVEIVHYVGEALWIKYLDKEPFKVYAGDFKKCQIAGLLGKRTSEFRVEIGTTFEDDKRNLTIIDREYRAKEKIDNKGRISIPNYKYYKYKCNVCGWEGDERSWVSESNLIGKKEQGCSCCHGRTVVEGINDIPTTAPEMIPYFQGGYNEAKQYTKGTDKRIIPICPDCGRIGDREMKIDVICKHRSIGCICSDGKSYNEKFMFNVLEQLNISFETEFTPEWCKYEYKSKLRQGRYDFLFDLNNKKYIVETDGEWHKKDNNMSGQTKEESESIDCEKDRLAREHNIEPIRIDCFKSDLEWIKDKIINSELNDLFDFNNINWLKCHEFALRNLVKKACEIKRDNPNMTSTEIGKTMKLCTATIINYLKKGSKVWDWINYNPKEESLKGNSKAGKMHEKQVEIFKNDISLGVFESGAELSRISEERFGIKLVQSSISNACNKNNQHKGFTFKYIDQNNINPIPLLIPPSTEQITS